MDKEYEALLENYEDAMMRLVMYRVAQEDGKQLLKEAEQLEVSGFEVPKEFDEKCLKLIREASASGGRKPVQLLNESHHSETRTRSHPRLRMVGRMALAAVLTATLMFTVAYAASPEFREGVLTFFTKVEEVGTYFFFRSDGADTPMPNESSPLIIKDEMPFEFLYIPSGYENFEMLSSEHGENAKHYLCSYVDKHDDINNFSLEILPVSENSTVVVDTEDATVQNIVIHDCKGMLIQKTDILTEKNQVQCVWVDGENKWFYSYFSLGISTEESQKILDNIVVNNK